MTFISQLSDMFQLTVEGLQATNSLCSSALHLSYCIGQCIVTGCVHLVYKMYTLLQVLYSVVYILYEDYCVFIIDLITKAKWFLGGIHFTFTYIYDWIQQMTTVFKNSYECFMNGVYSHIEFIFFLIHKGGSSLLYVLEVIKQALVFMGSSVWYLVSIIPISIVYMVTLLLCFISDTVEEVFVVLSRTCQTAFYSVQKLVLFFSDVPMESAFGLVVGTLGFCFLIKNYSLLVQCAANLISLFLRSGQCIVGVWNYFRHILLRFVPASRNRNVQSIAFETLQERCTEGETSMDSATYNTRSCYANEMTSKLCIVCQDKEKSVIVLPCRHVCLCVVCCAIIEEQYGKCPICRHRVERTMTVYI